MTCTIDGNLLYETNEVPSQDAIKWIQFAAHDTQENYFEGSTGDATTTDGAGNMSARAMPQRD